MCTEKKTGLLEQVSISEDLQFLQDQIDTSPDEESLMDFQGFVQLQEVTACDSVPDVNKRFQIEPL